MAKIKKTGRHTSAIKTSRQALRHRTRNFKIRGELKELRKEFIKAVSAKDKDKAQKTLVESFSKLDKAAKVGVIHWRNAARKKSFLSRQVQVLAS